MKTWYLFNVYTLEYAIVYADSKYNAFHKLMANRELFDIDILDWEIEEFTEDTYDGILYFN